MPSPHSLHSPSLNGTVIIGIHNQRKLGALWQILEYNSLIVRVNDGHWRRTGSLDFKFQKSQESIMLLHYIICGISGFL